MPGILKQDRVIVESESEANRLYNKGYYGTPLSGGGLELNLFEARLLMKTDRLEVIDDQDTPVPLSTLIKSCLSLHPGSSLQYPVYSDMRRRGYVLKKVPPPADFRVFPRGGGPGKTPSKYWLIAHSETDRFTLSDIEEMCSRIMKLKKEMLSGTLDEEGDVTYYKISTIDLNGKTKIDELAHDFNGVIYGDKCVVDDGKELYEDYFFGNRVGDEIYLSLLEADYLNDRGILDVVNGCTEERMDGCGLRSYAIKRQKDYEVRYGVYSDLRNRGLIPKTGFKYGTAFRCYVGDPDHHHAEYMVQPVDEEFECSWYDVSRAVRVAHSVRKNFAFGRMGKDDFIYTRIERKTP